MAGIGNEKVFENDNVVVWNFALAPGEESPVHTHTRQYMWYAIEGAPLRLFNEKGEDIGVFEVPTGAVYSLKVEDGYIEVLSDISKGSRFPVTHSARNEGTTPYREVLVEYK